MAINRAEQGVDPVSEPLWQTPGLLILLLFVVLFVGYASGRRLGKREGYMEGMRFSPLEIRKESWQRGHCVICGSTAEMGGIEEEKDRDERLAEMEHVENQGPN